MITKVTYEILFKSECLPCPPGMNCRDPTNPLVCPNGTYPQEDPVGCQKCEKGNFCIQGLMDECPPGTYCEDTGMDEPTPCPTGEYCEGGLHKDDCPDKKYSEIGWPECKSCPAAYFCDGGIKQNCPKGFLSKL